MNRFPKSAARLALAFVVGLIAFTASCRGAQDEFDVASTQDQLTSPVTVILTAPRYPTSPDDMASVYNGRTFLVDGIHLGYDIALTPGTPVYAIGNGVVQVYRPANGYGRLAVVVEYRLATPIEVLNGNNELVTVTSFIVIHGHLRTSVNADGTGGTLSIHPGDMVGPNDVLGYVDDDATNGDGAEHVHFGIRLQTAVDAAKTDVNWFRGYDTAPSQRKWYADPLVFMETLTSNILPVSWHPSGTVLIHPSDNTYWVVDQHGLRHQADAAVIMTEGLDRHAIMSTLGELSCLEIGDAFVSPRAGSELIKFDDASTVYETSPSGYWRRAFVNYEAFVSWGWHDSQISTHPASERAEFFAAMQDLGFRTMRPGSLVKASGESEVAVVVEDRRLPIFDWPTFLALGYRADEIVTIPKGSIDVVAGPRGPLMTSELIAQCLHPSSCVVNCPPPTQGGGTGEDPPDDTPPENTPPENGVPAGKVHFQYTGPVSGAYQLQGMWDPPGVAFYDWVPSTFALCPDTNPSDMGFDCLLDMPSGTVNVLFTVKLPDGRWWGDESCAPTGGCGATIGTVTLTGPSGVIAYQMQPNNSGPPYYNGFVPLVP